MTARHPFLERPAAEPGGSAEQAARASAAQFSLPYVDLNGFTVTQELFERLPAAQAYALSAVPYRLNGGTLEVAVLDPADLALPERLENLTRMRGQLVVASAAAIPAAPKRPQGPGPGPKG